MKHITRLALFATMSAAAVSFSHVGALAGETAGEKVENKVGDVKTDAKKSHRKAKRQSRKRMGNDNLLKDARDQSKDIGDDVSNTAEKAKRKAD